MGLHLVTGYAGYQHVTAADHGAFHDALLMSGNYVLNSGKKFAASVITNNNITISDGELIMQGRHIRLEPGKIEEVTIENGAQDYKRNDLIVVRYTKNGTTGVESVSLVVLQGTPDLSAASDPAYINGNILNGILTADFPLYRVPLNGLTVGTLEPLFEVKDNFDKRIKDIVGGTTKVAKAAAADTATRATNDANGKNIASTYETKENVEKILAGITSGETATGNAAALGGETAFAWQTKLDNIQTTSRAALSEPGWYRVAEVTNITANSTDYGNLFRLACRYGSLGGVNGAFLIERVSSKGTINPLGIMGFGQVPFTKIRLTSDGTKDYIEVYYSFSATNRCAFSVNALSANNGNYITWQTIDATLTSETVDGVTVTTTYDIPANASPVTDLDLVRFKGTEVLNTSILEYAIASENGFHNVALGGESYPSNLDLPNDNYRYGDATIIKYAYSSTIVIVWGRRSGTPILYPPAFNCYNGTEWGGWQTFATTSDLTTALAGYLKNSGDVEHSGNIGLVTSGTSAKILKLKNSLREIRFGVSSDGSYSQYDATNGKNIIYSLADGTNTFNGTASGNVALNGNGTQSMTAYATMPFEVDNIHSANDGSYMGFKRNGTSYGRLGFNGADSPVVYSNGLGVKVLHHDGNSAKVAISESAPSDTSALWVY